MTPRGKSRCGKRCMFTMAMRRRVRANIVLEAARIASPARGEIEGECLACWAMLTVTAVEETRPPRNPVASKPAWGPDNLVAM